MKKTVAIFGDSVLKGVIYDDKKKKHVFSKAIDWSYIQHALNIEIQNYAKMGATIQDGKKRLEKYLNGNPRVDMILIEFGGNDCDFDWQYVGNMRSKDHEPKTPPVKFKEILVYMVELIRVKGIKPILMTLPTIDAKRYFHWITSNGNNKENILYFLGDIEHIYRFHELYNLAIMEIANEMQVELIDIRKTFLKNGNLKDLICEDGIHPTPYGERLIVNEIVMRYQPQKQQEKTHLYNKPILTYN